MVYSFNYNTSAAAAAQASSAGSALVLDPPRNSNGIYREDAKDAKRLAREDGALPLPTG